MPQTELAWTNFSLLISETKTQIYKAIIYEISHIDVILRDGVAYVAALYLINGNKRFNNFQRGIFVKFSLIC